MTFGGREIRAHVAPVIVRAHSRRRRHGWALLSAHQYATRTRRKAVGDRRRQHVPARRSRTIVDLRVTAARRALHGDVTDTGDDGARSEACSLAEGWFLPPEGIGACSTWNGLAPRGTVDHLVAPVSPGE